MSTPTPRAGAAKAEITPPPGTQLAGQVGRKRPAQTFLDPLYARAAVFENGEQKICLVALDVTFVTAPVTAAIRKAASEATGISPAAICLHATQTHNAPSLGGFQFDDEFPLPEKWDWLRFEEREYSQGAIAKIVEAIRLANENLEPVEIGIGSAIDGRWAFNRRAVMKDGMVMMPFHTPPSSRGWTQMKYLEGPIDPEVGVLAARGKDQNLITALLNYACHPVHMFWQPGGIVSADWCGAMCDEFSSQTGNASNPLLLNGCCGNLNPWNPFDPDYREDHVAMGKSLANSARKAFDAMEWKNEAILDYRSRIIKLPLRDLNALEVEAAQKLLHEQPEPLLVEAETEVVDWDWLQAAFRESVRLEKTRAPEMNYEIQVFRIGDAAFVALPGEPFIEGQLQIKLDSPTDQTFVLHAANHYAGYIPTREAFARGGHEVNLSTWAKLAPEALEMIVEASVEMLRELFFDALK